jgi:DNA polymerase-3 subunit epsilon
LQHAIRVFEALAPLKLVAWPFAGPAALPEGDVLHVVDAWCYLGTARDEADIARLLADRDAQFDRDCYRILVRHRDRLRPLPGRYAAAGAGPLESAGEAA